MGEESMNPTSLRERLAIQYKTANRERVAAGKPRLTYKTLAETCGVSESAVNKWFSKKSRVVPSVENLLKLAPLLDCDVEYLLDIQDDPRRKVSDVCAATGLSEAAAAVLVNMAEEGNRALFVIDALITSDFLLDIYSAATNIYFDDYTRYENQFISAKRMYAAEKAILFEDLMDFVNKLRVDHGLDPFK